jgi:hypothetical protein
MVRRFFQHALTPIAAISATHPIEVIAICLLIASCCYFSLVHLPTSADVQPHFQSVASRVAVTTDRVVQMSSPNTDLLVSPDSSLVMKQVIITSSDQASAYLPRGVLTRSILVAALDLEEKIKALTVSQHAPGLPEVTFNDVCYRVQTTGNKSEIDQPAPCLYISPLSLWNSDKETLANDENILDTVASALADDTVVNRWKALLESSMSDNKDAGQGFVGASIWNIVKDTLPGRSDVTIIKKADSLVLSFIVDVSTPEKAALGNLWLSKIDSLRTPSLYPRQPSIESSYANAFQPGGKTSFIHNFIRKVLLADGSILQHAIFSITQFSEVCNLST